MGYWQFIFQHEKWYDLYEKNCSLKTQEEWYAEGKPNISLGIFYCLVGFIYELTYLPFLLAMAKPEFFQHSCYKLMFLMGMIDIFVLPCIGIIWGIQVIKGAHFCNNPKFYYLVGVIASCGFYAVITLCVILAFDRFLEMCFPKVATKVFGGKRVYFWMALPIIYQIYTGFQVPYIFSIKVYAANHDPYYLVHGMENNPNFKFSNFQSFFIWNICLLDFFLVFFYGGLLVVTKIQTTIYDMPSISKAQKLMTLQAICICGEMFIAPILHILMLFYELPIYIEIFAHFGWISIHGDTPIIYFIMNASLRKAVIEMFPFKIKIPILFKFLKSHSSNVVEPKILTTATTT